MIKFTIYSDPIAQGRPKFSTRGGFAKVYDPKKSRDWKELVAMEAKRRGCYQLDGPLRMILVFRLRKPKSAPRSRKYPIVKPDTSNFIKGIEDALNGICYHDDSQIIILEAQKVYAPEGIEPGVLIQIEQIK
jgi:Holliday junction resolvase RusA-like endonuclease